MHIKVAQLRLEAIRFRDTKHLFRHKNDGFMSANHISATFWLISCPERDFDGLRARYRGNHGEIAVCGNKISEIMAEVQRSLVDSASQRVLSAYARVDREGGWHYKVPTSRGS